MSYSRYHRNKRCIHLNKSRTNKRHNWHNAQVFMNNNIPSERVTLKGKILQNLKVFEKETPQKSLGRHNVNFRLNKFDQIYFWLFLISLPDTQFSIPRNRIISKDQKKNGGGILFYIKKTYLTKWLKCVKALKHAKMCKSSKTCKNV